MSQPNRATNVRKSPAANRYSAPLTVAKSVLATAALMGAVVGGIYLGSGYFATHQTGDDVSEAQKQERIEAYTALSALQLAAVPEADVPEAVNSMQLSPAAKHALLADLSPNLQATAGASSTAEAAAASPASGTHSASSMAAAQPPANQTQAGTRTLPTRKVAPDTISPMKLVWITLWDTDAEDGDAIRIDSQGYSRTVILTKQPVTFAIPVPVSDVVSITGVRDGEGGGITVGLASGASKAVLPIMSVGQVLNLKVKVH
jgi:hypothetical protein